MNDTDVVAAQIGRTPRSPVVVTTRCHLGLPVVITVPPHLDDGTPFPTRYWLTCPLAVIRVSRIESTGGVKQAEARIDHDSEFAAEHEAAMVRYRIERDAQIPPRSTDPKPSGGVAGARRGVKCLHAHYADHAVGNANPVGRMTAADIEPLDCAVACCRADGEKTERNAEWSEPRR